MTNIHYFGILCALLMVLTFRLCDSSGKIVRDRGLDGTFCENNQSICNISSMLQTLFRGYDKALRPFINENRPVTITCGLWILSIDSINVIDMDYRIDLFLRQSWLDSRLATNYPTNITVSNSMLENIWIPDTYFENSKHSNFHSVTTANKMLRIGPGGTIYYNARISVRASCPMDLHTFPVDRQTCNLLIDSYGYSNKDLVYEWEEGDDRIMIDTKENHLPQYNLTSYSTKTMMRQFVTGNWSGLKFMFTLERRYEHFVLHLYAPCAMIVMLSWISFFIDKSVIPARIALGITSILTTTTILNIQNNSMPKVSYIKLADWYLIFSFLFVFAVLIEYTIVLYLAAKDKHRQKLKGYEKTLKKLREEKLLEAYGCNPPVYLSLLPRPVPKYDHPNLLKKEDSDEELPENPNHKYRCRMGTIRVDVIDEHSRIIFPLAFLIFNIFYWIYFYIQKADQSS